MIPILFNGDAITFTSNGIGRLTDAISCEVKEERNGIFELEMVYPTNGVLYSELAVSKLIVVKPNKKQERQAFEIYEITKPINQKVRVYANHVSYRQSFVPVAPFSAQGITDALQGIKSNELEQSEFTFWTDIENVESTYNQTVPKSMRQCLGGTEGSILDVFSGSGAVEYEWDNFVTKVWSHRGEDNGVQLRYSKNITALEQSESIENTITGVLPTWTDPETGASVYGQIQYSSLASNYPIHRTVILDLSDKFDTAPIELELNAAGQNYISQSGIGIPNTNIKVSFVDLSQTDEYKELSVLEDVNLCDNVTVIYEPLNISYSAKVVSTVWDVLADKYIEIEVGAVKSTLSKTISDNIGDISELNITNNKLVSVTQKIDRDVGQISSTVLEIEGDLSEVDGKIQEQITAASTGIIQNAKEITLTAVNETVGAELNDVGERVGTLESYIEKVEVSVGVYGLRIRKNAEGSYVLITDEGMEIYVNNQKQAYATIEGFKASNFVVDDHWNIDTLDTNGYVLGFWRKA